MPREDDSTRGESEEPTSLFFQGHGPTPRWDLTEYFPLIPDSMILLRWPMVIIPPPPHVESRILRGLNTRQMRDFVWKVLDALMVIRVGRVPMSRRALRSGVNEQMIAQALILFEEHYIAPGAWRGWHFDNAADYVAEHGGIILAPSIRKLFAPKAFERRGIFRKENPYNIARAFMGPAHHEAYHRYQRMMAELSDLICADIRPGPETITAIKQQHFPGNLYDELRISNLAFVDKATAHIHMRIRRGDWLWDV